MGFVTNYPFGEEEARMCRRLMLSLVRRGEHAWGFFDGENVYKEPGNFYFSEYNSERRLEQIVRGKKIFLCHTRWATRGSPKKNRNNHPFVLRPFVFAHNGTLFYTDRFDNRWGIETDSFWLLYWIWWHYQETRDTVESIKQGVKHVRGGYACWLYNFEDGGTYLFRNNRFPTVYTKIENEKGSGILFGSDIYSIWDALEDEVKAKGTKAGVIYRIEEGVMEKVGEFRWIEMRRWELRMFEKIHGRFREYDVATLEVVGNGDGEVFSYG